MSKIICVSQNGEASPLRGGRTMRTGWLLSRDGLLRPSGGAERADVLALRGSEPFDLNRAALAVAAEAKRIGASAVFCELEARADFIARFCSAVLGLGPTVYCTDAAADAVVVRPDLPRIDSGEPYGAYVWERADVTEIGGRKRSAGEAELRALTEKHGRSAGRADELMADYFTFCEGGKTCFALYDTPQTIALRLSRLERDENCRAEFIRRGSLAKAIPFLEL